MLFNKKSTGLVLAGLAAYAYYKYNKLSDADKKEMTDKWKQKGRKIYDDYVPATVKNWIEKDNANGAMATETPNYTF